MEGRIGGPIGCQDGQIDGIGATHWQGLAKRGNCLSDRSSALRTKGACKCTSEEACGTYTTAASSPEVFSPSAPLDAIPSASALEALKTKQTELTPGSCCLNTATAAAAPPLPSCVTAVAATDPCSAVDASLDAVAAVAAAIAVEATANSRAAGDYHTMPSLDSSSSVAASAHDAAKATADSAVPATISAVADAGIPTPTVTTAKPLMAAAGYMGLGSLVGSSRKKEDEAHSSSCITNVNGEAAQARRIAEAGTSSPNGLARDIGATDTNGDVLGVGRLLGHLRLPALPQWLCSPASNRDRSLGCGVAVADTDTELQGSEAEAAAAAHMAALAAASAAVANRREQKGPQNSYSEVDGSPFQPGTLKASAAPSGAGLTAAIDSAVVAIDTDTDDAARGSGLGRPHEADSEVRCMLRQYLPGGAELQPRRSSTGPPSRWNRSLSSETTRELLQLLEERAARAAAHSSCTSPPGVLNICLSPLDTTASDSHDAQALLLQHHLTEHQEATAVIAPGQEGLLQQNDEGGSEAGSSEEATTAAARAQRALDYRKQTVWTSLMGTLAESSRRSVEAVQRTAGTAASAAGAADKALDALVAPLFRACRAPTTHIHEGSEHMPVVVVPAEQREEGETTPEDAQGLTNGSGEQQPTSNPENTGAAPAGLLLELQRRQHAIAEELRQRSSNLLQHSVALTTSSSLSEARYHLAEIVDTGGPEVSGVWAGFKVGLGIVTLASGHLLLGGAMVAVATGSLGSAVFWGRHRQEFYELMRGGLRDSNEESQASEASENNGATTGPSGLHDDMADGRVDSSTSSPRLGSTSEEFFDAEDGGIALPDHQHEHNEEIAARARYPCYRTQERNPDDGVSGGPESGGPACHRERREVSPGRLTRQSTCEGEPLPPGPSAAAADDGDGRMPANSCFLLLATQEDSLYVDCDEDRQDTAGIKVDVASNTSSGYGQTRDSSVC